MLITTATTATVAPIASTATTTTRPSRSLRARLAIVMTTMTTAAMAMAFSACAHNAAVSPTHVDSARVQALEAVAHQGSGKIVAGGVVFSRTQSGSVRAEPVHADATLASQPDDVAIEAELRGRVATDPTLANRDVDIDVDKGVVRLSGTVADSTHAAHLFDIALALPGVRAVESSLAWISSADLHPGGPPRAAR